MVKVPTQTPVTILFLLLLSLETSFVPSVPLNLSVAFFCIVYMCFYRKFHMMIWMVFLAILPGFANYWAVHLHGEVSQAVLLGVTLVFGTNGIVTVLGLCLVSGFQCFSADSERN